MLRMGVRMLFFLGFLELEGVGKWTGTIRGREWTFWVGIMV